VTYLVAQRSGSDHLEDVVAIRKQLVVRIGRWWLYNRWIAGVPTSLLWCTRASTVTKAGVKIRQLTQLGAVGGWVQA
jgi:hypothetical protein